MAVKEVDGMADSRFKPSFKKPERMYIGIKLVGLVVYSESVKYLAELVTPVMIAWQLTVDKAYRC